MKIRQDMDIKIPEEVMGIKKWECEVVSNKNVATFIKEFVVKLPPGENLDFQSGGYIQIDVPKCNVDFSQDIDVDEQFRDEWDQYKLWDLKCSLMKSGVKMISSSTKTSNSPLALSAPTFRATDLPEFLIFKIRI